MSEKADIFTAQDKINLVFAKKMSTFFLFHDQRRITVSKTLLFPRLFII